MLSQIIIQGENWVETSEEMPKKAINIAIYPDGSHMATTEQNSDWLINYTINNDGSLSNRQQFYWIHNPFHQKQEIKGMEFDTLGNLYVATQLGIQVCDHNGRVRAILPYPNAENIDAFAFADNTIYVSAGNKTYCRKINATVHKSTDKHISVKSQGQG
jgi:sugar lactone lactonase YvrE